MDDAAVWCYVRRTFRVLIEVHDTLAEAEALAEDLRTTARARAPDVSAGAPGTAHTTAQAKAMLLG